MFLLVGSAWVIMTLFVLVKLVPGAISLISFVHFLDNSTEKVYYYHFLLFIVLHCTHRNYGGSTRLAPLRNCMHFVCYSGYHVFVVQAACLMYIHNVMSCPESLSKLYCSGYLWI